MTAETTDQIIESTLNKSPTPTCYQCQKTTEPYLIYHPLKSSKSHLACDYCYYENRLDHLAAEIDNLLQIPPGPQSGFRLIKLLVFYQKSLNKFSPNSFLRRLHQQIYQDLTQQSSRPPPEIVPDPRNPVNANKLGRQVPYQRENAPDPASHKHYCPDCHYGTNRMSTYKQHLLSKRHLRHAHNIIVERKIRTNRPLDESDDEIELKQVILIPKPKPQPTPELPIPTVTEDNPPTQKPTIPSAEVLSIFNNPTPPPNEEQQDDDSEQPQFALMQSNIAQLDPLANLPKTLPMENSTSQTTPQTTPIQTPQTTPIPEKQEKGFKGLSFLQSYQINDIPNFSVSDTLDYFADYSKKLPTRKFEKLAKTEQETILRLLASLFYHSQVEDLPHYQKFLKRAPSSPFHQQIRTALKELKLSPIATHQQQNNQQQNNKSKPHNRTINRFNAASRTRTTRVSGVARRR